MPKLLQVVQTRDVSIGAGVGRSSSRANSSLLLRAALVRAVAARAGVTWLDRWQLLHPGLAPASPSLRAGRVPAPPQRVVGLPRPPPLPGLLRAPSSGLAVAPAAT